MYFKRIEMVGFKSFADKLEIDFDSGITAIVGPNGCGKSNVGDAIRWVLGEQSSKALRGSTMQDVIFNGTERRKSLSYCEATLVFDNSDRYFDYDYNELAVTRKLYRSGESEYLINRNPCRLKDIINIFYDSGIGRDGYSIIGQGQVTEIFSAKPENRRLIFEEAAGIAKFRNRKQEAERKLERTRSNLVYLRDKLGDLSARLGPLKKQAEDAKKYLDYREKLKDLEVNSFVYQYENTNTAKQKIFERINALNEEIDAKQTDIDNATKKYNGNMDEINNIDRKIDSLHNQILNLTVEMEKHLGEVKLVRERINHLNEQNDRINLDLLNVENDILKDEKEREYKKELIENTTSELEALNKSYEEITAEYLKTIDDLSLNEDEAESSQKDMLEKMDKIADIRANISKYTAEKDYLKAESEKYDKEIKAYQIEVDKLNKSKQEAQESVENSKQEMEDSSEKYAATKFKIESITNQIKEEEQQTHELSAKIQVYENRIRLLMEWQAEYEGYAYSVKKILKESEKNFAIRDKMLGVLASLIKVPEKYETAIEIALGNALQNIVTFDEHGAKQLIEYLKQNQYGRATFLPISSVKSKSSLDNRQFTNVKGCFGVASELISHHQKIGDIVSSLLGTTVVVDNLDTAISLANNSRFGYKIVTLDGDVIFPQGSMTGGSKKSESVNLISREREIETIKKATSEKQAEFLNLKENIKIMSVQLDNLKKDVYSYEIKKNSSEVRLAKDSEKLENINTILENYLNQLQTAETAKKNADEKVEIIERELSGNSMSNDINVSRDEVNEKLAERQKLYAELREKRDELNSNQTTIRVAIAENRANIENLERDILRLNESIVIKQGNLENIKDQQQRNNETIKQAEDIISELIENSSSTESKQQLAVLKDSQTTLEQNKIDLQEELKVLDEKKSVLQGEIAVLTEKKFKQDMLVEKVDSDIEVLQTRILEEYELTYETCLPLRRDDFEIGPSGKEIAKYKKDIAGLGYVNVHAIEESKVVLEQYEVLNEQVEDCEKAETELTDIIVSLSSEMVVRFKTQFDKINENFKITFKELFGGGNAMLVLTEENNLLESGVDIIAEPPGKKLQNINLLSGGEKALTAIAILFSILRLRPMPFCLLDEIEAALDEANVDRFAQYLRRFAKNTQFIVITHRKPTMELADRLFGVTMEEKGVSKVVSVNLSDAVKSAEKANGDN